jgi:hypothetical protein
MHVEYSQLHLMAVRINTFATRATAVALGFLALITGASAEPCAEKGSIKRVTNTRVGKFDYVTFEIQRPANPAYEVTDETGPFTEGDTDEPVPVTGDKFKQITFRSMPWGCTIAEKFSLPGGAIIDIKKTDQFEGFITYVVGYRSDATYVDTRHSDTGSIRKIVMRFKH